MYRFLLPLLLCRAVVAAPQAIIDSDITYVKLQPSIEAPIAPSHYRESRIEHLPLTIPGNISLEDRNLAEKNHSATEKAETQSSDADKSVALEDSSNDITLPESSNLSEITALPEGAALPDTAGLPHTFVPARIEPETGLAPTDLSEKTLPEETALPEITVPERTLLEKIAQPERTLPEKAEQSQKTLPEKTVQIEGTFTEKTEQIEGALPEQTEQPEGTLPDKTEQSEGTLPEITETEQDELLEAHGSDVSDTIPSETFQSERRGRTYESSETTDIFEEPTERYEDITQKELEAPRTRATPKFVPKLSYFQKPQVFVSFPTNSIEKSAKRRFRSNCRCEKIWNCPKLQISVPRCPNEYFLCCF